MAEHSVRCGLSPSTGWPEIADAATFVSADPADPVLQLCLDKAIVYGQVVLGEAYDGVVAQDVFTACLDFCGSTYVERIGQSDIVIEGLQGSVSLSRYRRILLASRFTAIA